MSSLQNRILRYIDEQLDAIARAPAMWAPPHCVELQVIQLLEFRSVTLRPELEQTNPRAVLDAYEAFLARTFPGAPPSPLAVLLERQNRSSELMTIFDEFRRELMQELRAENVFARHDLVLTLRMRPDTAPRATALTSYYSAFHSVLRAVARPVGTRGHASRDIEDAIDFSMGDVHIVPANGAPAQIVMPLDRLESAQAERVQGALEEIVAVNEWAADPTSPVEELRARLHAEQAPERVAAQVLRLMPDERASVQTVELGGRLISRAQPVMIQPSYAARMLAVIKAEEHEPRVFEQVGTVRAIDIDQRSMRISVGKNSFKCWLDDARLVDVARHTLARWVHVVGHAYRKSGRTVIIIEEIQPVTIDIRT